MPLRALQVVQPLQSDSVSHSEQAGCGEDGQVNYGKTVWTHTPNTRTK